MSLVIPKGKVYVDLFDDNDALTGERYFGRTPGLTVNISSESLEHYNAESGINEKDEEEVTKINRAGNLTVDEVDDDNLALFVIGDKSTIAQAATPVVDEAITVLQDRYYQLGQFDQQPDRRARGRQRRVTGPSGTPSYTVDTDYTVDAVLGRLYIVPGGGIADESGIEVDYTPAVKSRTQIASSSLASKSGAIRFVADNPKGANRDWYFPKVTLKPNGDATLKQTDPAWFVMGFALEILKPDDRRGGLYRRPARRNERHDAAGNRRPHHARPRWLYRHRGRAHRGAPVPFPGGHCGSNGSAGRCYRIWRRCSTRTRRRMKRTTAR